MHSHSTEYVVILRVGTSSVGAGWIPAYLIVHMDFCCLEVLFTSASMPLRVGQDYSCSIHSQETIQVFSVSLIFTLTY